MNKGNQLPLVFNNDYVSKPNSQKHLGLAFDNRLSFDEHLKMITINVNKTIGLLRKLHEDLRRSHQLTIYNVFVRLHLDYCGIISDQDYKFSPKLELIKYDVCLAITRAKALWPSGLGNYFVCKRFAVQTLLRSLEFVTQANLELDTITV